MLHVEMLASLLRIVAAFVHVFVCFPMCACRGWLVMCVPCLWMGVHGMIAPFDPI